MNVFNKVSDAITSRFPMVRRPNLKSNTDDYLKNYGWTLQRRNKSMGVGWSTYYQAMNNVWINACIQTYCDEIVNLDYTIKNPNSDVVDDARVNYLTGLFRDPMGLSSNDTYEIFNILMWKSYLGLGDAFAEVIHDDKFNNVPIGLRHIPTEYMLYHADTDQWGLMNDSYRFENDEIIHIKDPDIKGSVWGESKIDVLARDITMEILGRDYTTDILDNKGLDPRGIIEYDADIDDDVWNNEIRRLQAEATHNRKGTMIVRGAKYTKASSTNQDMEFVELMKDIRDRIIATYGVPPAKVSIIETANLGSGSGLAQDKQFKKTLKGKSKLFEGAYRKVLGRSAFDEVFEYGDLDIQDARERADIDNIRIGNGSLTVNEVRSSYGESPVSWGDAPQNNNNLLSLNRKYDDNLEKMGLLMNNKY